jgi:signal transduction histidine kinase
MIKHSKITVWLQGGLWAGSSPFHYLFTLTAVFLVSLVAQVLGSFIGFANLALLYLLPVLVAAVWWGRGPSFFASILGVMSFDYFFVPPAFSFMPTQPQDYFILTIFLIVAIVAGTMANTLRDERERLRALSSRLETIREEERTTVAREIHDELGQALTGLKLDLAQLSKKLPLKDAALMSHVKSLGEVIDDTIGVIRRISTELRPGILDELGLKAAIEWQVEDFASRVAEIDCQLLATLDDTDLDHSLSTALFRILQEALTNIVRHAYAKHVRIHVKEEAGFVVMMVEDDGRGITEHEVHDPKSLGLLGIRERARILGGEVQISSGKGKGTSLIVRIPIRRTERKHA